MVSSSYNWLLPCMQSFGGWLVFSTQPCLHWLDWSFSRVEAFEKEVAAGFSVTCRIGTGWILFIFFCRKVPVLSSVYGNIFFLLLLLKFCWKRAREIFLIEIQCCCMYKLVRVFNVKGSSWEQLCYATYFLVLDSNTPSLHPGYSLSRSPLGLLSVIHFAAFILLATSSDCEVTLELCISCNSWFLCCL